MVFSVSLKRKIKTQKPMKKLKSIKQFPTVFLALIIFFQFPVKKIKPQIYTQ